MTTKTTVKRIEEARNARAPRRLLIHWPADYAGPHAGKWTEGGRELTDAEAAAALAAGTRHIDVEYTASWGNWRPELTPAGMAGVVGGAEDE